MTHGRLTAIEAIPRTPVSETSHTQQPTLEALLAEACEIGFPVMARERDGRWKAEFSGLAFYTEVRRNTAAEALSAAIAKARKYLEKVK